MTDFFKKYALRNTAIMELEGATFEVRPMSQANRDFFLSYRVMQANIDKEHKEGTRQRAIAEDEGTIDVAANTLIVDWKGVEKDGKPYPYCVENAKELFTQARQLYNQIVAFCSDESNFRDTEADGKKSVT